jgi:hypothetical protein
LDIASQELQNSGDPLVENIAAKMEICIDDADRNLGDMYHVMNLQRLNRFFNEWELFNPDFFQPPLSKRFAAAAHFPLQRTIRITGSRCVLKQGLAAHIGTNSALELS